MLNNYYRNTFLTILSRHIVLSVALFLSITLRAWDGVSVLPPPLHNGTYQISNPEELAWIAQQSTLTTFEGYIIELQQSIDLSEASNWTPIGSAAVPFQGRFEGRSHSIANLNISYCTATQDIGLFGYIGQNGVVNELAIKSGKIFLDKKQYVGCLAGQNYGEITCCFNLGQIMTDESDYVGSIAGYNGGIINHCYNAGIISAGRNYVGGLTGYNAGHVSNCYNIGHTKASGICGAITGGNETGSVFTNVYYDIQMCLLNAAPENISGITGMATRDMSSILSGDAAYIQASPLYPQLACFAESAEKDLSIVSAVPATLDNTVPIQRAEGVSKSFSVYTDNATEWISPASDVIEIHYAGAIVNRPCQKQEILIQAVRGDNVKKVYLLVEGFNVFDAGYIRGERQICSGELIRFSDSNFGGEGRTASGGKNDDPQNAPYYYRLRLYKTTETEGVADTTLFRSVVLTQQDYTKYLMYTSEPGRFFYKRDAHDSQCHTEWSEATGTCYYEVTEDFNAGQIHSEPDTLYGNFPRDTTIFSIEDAHGGIAPYTYRWYLTQLQINYVTHDTTIIIRDQMIQEGRNPVDTATYRPRLTTPGEYFFTRVAHDAYCHSKEFAESDGVKHFVVFDTLYPGSIPNGTKQLCTLGAEDTIPQTAMPSGGNGRYLYRWLCNGKPIQGADSAFLALTTIPFDYGETYLLQREVKDDTGLMDWTLSDGEYQVSVYDKFLPGTIVSSDETLCLTTGEEQITLTATEQSAAHGGEGDVTYRWKLSHWQNGRADSLNVFEQDTMSYSYNFHMADYPTLPIPCTILLTREVQNTVCSEEWITSDGEVKMTIGKETEKTEKVTVCRSELPYTATYTYTDGHGENYTLREAGETVTFHDHSSIGCQMEVTLVCNVTEKPEVEIEPIGTICQTDSILTLYFHITKGNPNRYAIDFNANALQAGFVPVEGQIDNRKQLSIPFPIVPVGNYELYIHFFTESQNQHCTGTPDTLTFTVGLSGFVHAKWDDVLFVDNNDKNGIPDTKNDLKFIAYQWYKDGTIIEGATKQTYWEEGGLNGVYHVVLTDAAGNVYHSCDVEKRPATNKPLLHTDIEINPVPVDTGANIYVKTTGNGWCAIFDVAGNLLYRQQAAEGINILASPTRTGIFVLQFTNDQGEVLTHKLIVK